MPTVLDLFSPAARAWFSGAFSAPTEVQEGGWRSVAAGQHTLMSAPTGSGKTLAAFLWCIDRLATEPVPAEAERCRVLYVSPLKALTVDIERNLQAPLRGIGLQAERIGLTQSPISVAIRDRDRLLHFGSHGMSRHELRIVGCLRVRKNLRDDNPN